MAGMKKIIVILYKVIKHFNAGLYVQYTVLCHVNRNSLDVTIVEK